MSLTKFLSTYPVRGTTFLRRPPERGRGFLSTYPVRGTTIRLMCILHKSEISIHVPRAGYDRRHHRFAVRKAIFLSTYPVRGTTIGYLYPCLLTYNFYPRTPCGVRRILHLFCRAAVDISIHVPRAGYDSDSSEQAASFSLFLSTYPVRGTTIPNGYVGMLKSISIHVPRAGYDLSGTAISPILCSFLSTYPVRGTT